MTPEKWYIAFWLTAGAAFLVLNVIGTYLAVVYALSTVIARLASKS